MWRRAQVNSGAGAVPISLASAGGSKIVRASLALSANGTIDFQDGSSNSLNGGPLPLAAGQPFSVGYVDQDDAVQNPIFLTGGAGGDAFPFTGAAIDWDFANGRYAPALGLTTTRASVAYADDLSGNWTQFAANTARITNKGLLVEEARTNSIHNNSMQGAVVGTPGTLPTNWAFTGALPGVSSQIVGVGTQLGIDYIDLRIFGTTNATSFAIVFDANTAIAASTSQAWAFSQFLALVGGSFNNVVGVTQRIIERDSGGATVVVDSQPSIQGSITSLLSRFTYLITTNPTTTAFVQPGLLWTVNNASAIDFTLRIGWPQLELGSFATSPIRTTAAAVTRAADVVTVTSPPVFGSAYSLFAAASSFRTGGAAGLASISDGTNNNRLQVYRANILVDNASLIAGGTTLWTPGGTAWPTNVLGKQVIAFASGDHAYCFNGGAVATDVTAGAPVGLNTIHIGSDSTGIAPWDGYITRVAVWPNQRLPNQSLQQLTSPGPMSTNGLNLVIAGAGTCTGYVDYMLAGGN